MRFDGAEIFWVILIGLTVSGLTIRSLYFWFQYAKKYRYSYTSSRDSCVAYAIFAVVILLAGSLFCLRLAGANHGMHQAYRDIRRNYPTITIQSLDVNSQEGKWIEPGDVHNQGDPDKLCRGDLKHTDSWRLFRVTCSNKPAPDPEYNPPGR